MRFRAELKYTPEDMRRYDRVYKKMRYRALVPVMDVLLVLLLLSLFAGYVLLDLVWHRWTDELTRYYLIFLVLLLVWVFLDLYRHSATSKALNRQGPAVLTADESGLRVTAGGIQSDYEYAAFTALAHGKDAYYLYIDKTRAVMIPERCFTEGDPATFGAYIEQRTGLKTKEIK